MDRIVIRENSLGRIAEGVEQATKLAHDNVEVYLLPDRDAPEGTEGDLLSYSLALACPEPVSYTHLTGFAIVTQLVGGLAAGVLANVICMLIGIA